MVGLRHGIHCTFSHCCGLSYSKYYGLYLTTVVLTLVVIHILLKLHLEIHLCHLLASSPNQTTNNDYWGQHSNLQPPAHIHVPEAHGPGIEFGAEGTAQTPNIGGSGQAHTQSSAPFWPLVRFLGITAGFRLERWEDE